MMAIMHSPRAVFMGSSEAAVPVLRALQELGWVLAAVYTAPDRSAGRQLHVRATAIKRYALAEGIPVLQPASWRRPEVARELERLQPDIVLVAAYGLLLPELALTIPRWGCLNVHPSLLPRNRGASPVVAAILGGDRVTGVTLFRMDAGLDTGPILAQRQVPLSPSARAGLLTEELFAIGAGLIKEALPEYLAGELTLRTQPKDGVTVTRRLEKVDGSLDWTKSASQLEREIRAYDPWPGSSTTWLGRRLQVLEASVLPFEPPEDARGRPGTVVRVEAQPPAIGVETGAGILVLHRVRLEGRRDMSTAEMVRGHGGFLDARLPS